MPLVTSTPAKALRLIAVVPSLLALLLGCSANSTSTKAIPPIKAVDNLAQKKTIVSSPNSPSPSLVPRQSPSPVPIPTEKADVVLIGSELEGMYLARAAADEGLVVKTIDPRDQPGGQLLQAEMQFLDAVVDNGGKGKLIAQGRVKELITGFRKGTIRKPSEFTAYYNKLVQGIPIESGIQIQDVERVPGLRGESKIDSVTYKSKNGSLHRIEADYWVENTDYAALVGKLGVERQPGLEAFFGAKQVEYMSAGLMMKFKNVDWDAFQKHGYTTVDANYGVGVVDVTKRYVSSNDRVFLRGLNAVNQRDGEVLVNALLVYQIDPSDERSIEEGMALGRQETELVLQHFRQSMAGWEHAELNGFPHSLYIREYNHYNADYNLQVSDMLSGHMFFDNVSIAGYPLDLQGLRHAKWGTEMGRPDKYGMPLRSFLLKRYENVILAGKNVGTTAIAYGSARIQQNTSIAAESIGAIIGHLRGAKKLKELQAGDWPELHRFLNANYHIKLSGIVAKNKLAGWTTEEIDRLNEGKINYTIFERTGKK
ncbi:FAD-dependent oxidoreductase [Cohnella faecalis]|uniref:FAD-dependent oxidoreductase n=1 Tax=Cohnella faecalis TaxID=2315694 RepID=A0A398CMZ4_9BACL|nr:FAD-dependent oxidoreductase [Cohnella faecalis]RIE00951.1 FAD-dependent oxidoreductase [Cohnella faecalis]